MAHDVSLPNEASAVDEYTNDANNDKMLNSDEQNSSDQEPSGYSSLEEKVANFIQNGELDSVEGKLCYSRVLTFNCMESALATFCSTETRYTCSSIPHSPVTYIYWTS